MNGGDEEAGIDRLPIDLLAHIFSLLTCFKDLAQASSVCRKWRQGVKESLGTSEKLSFAGWKMDDDSITRLVMLANGLKELDISRSRWGCQITDHGLYQLSMAKCICNLSSVSMWGSTAITDKGVVQMTIVLWGCRHVTENGLVVLVNKCRKLEAINVWGMRLPLDCFIGLLAISPALQIQPEGMLLNDQRVPIWPIF
ncbi:F-box protein At5g67140-like isoform X2 [Olea europaea var. sylvestris]|uniref:F-box At5g67140 n=1 Tax=Olea europaea subsp. europaea TaxID=158383 RepID=A0A8S0TTG9_OLEEU|nr:F-box protein At5g67140-like isoform X2 [Olea europaea var. sylvestris]CAA3007263.1 F-box At5g67140 [Olea europaea subsp. europaea]